MSRSLDILGRLNFPGQWLLADDNYSVLRPYLRLLPMVLLGIKYLIGNGRSTFHRALWKVPRLPLRPLTMKAICMRYYGKVVDYSNILESLSKCCIILLICFAFIGL